MSRLWQALLWLGVLSLLAGCAAGTGGQGVATTRPVSPNTTAVALELVRIFENSAAEPYFPWEGLAGCAYTSDGSLIVCDEKRGLVYGLDSGNGQWYEFDRPAIRPYRPVDVQVDGFKVLVLDRGTNTIQRFDLSGAHQDQVVDLRSVDPGALIQPGSFALDRDGRVALTDLAQQQALLLDTFFNLHSRMGEPGIQDDQFTDPRGIAFMPAGQMVIADTGNARLCLYGRMGFFEKTVGGRYDPNNPFLVPVAVAVDRHGNIFTADLARGQIIAVDRNFRTLILPVEDQDVNTFLQAPVDLAVGPQGQLAVTDRQRQAIFIYRIIYE